MAKKALDKSFGFRDVSSDERAQLIHDVFESVAPRYDLMNDVMSFGIHRLWKRAMARQARSAPGQTIVDLAGGTGDVARLLAGPERRVILADPSLKMMQGGRRPLPSGIETLVCPAESIPLADGSVDTLTMAFGIRNTTQMDIALREIARVLKPGGRFICLEFSRPLALIKPFYDAYSFWVIPRLGAWVAGEPAAYTYLIESIRRFPDQKAFAAMLQEAGLTDVHYRNLSFGIACLHEGSKPL